METMEHKFQQSDDPSSKADLEQIAHNTNGDQRPKSSYSIMSTATSATNETTSLTDPSYPEDVDDESSSRNSMLANDAETKSAEEETKQNQEKANDSDGADSLASSINSDTVIVKKKKRKRYKLQFTDKYKLLRWLDNNDIDIDDAVQWIREKNGENEQGEIIWKSASTSWAQRLLSTEVIEPPPDPPIPRTRYVCHWRGRDEMGNVYCCNNKVIRHAVTKELQPYCGWHMPTCIYFHHPGRMVPISCPNAGGMCESHYVTILKKRPSPMDLLDVRGVVLKFAREGMRSDDEWDLSDEDFSGMMGEDGEDGEDWLGKYAGDDWAAGFGEDGEDDVSIDDIKRDWKLNEICEGNFEGNGEWFNAKIAKCNNKDGVKSWHLLYQDGEKEKYVKAEYLRERGSGNYRLEDKARRMKNKRGLASKAGFYLRLLWKGRRARKLLKKTIKIWKARRFMHAVWLARNRHRQEKMALLFQPIVRGYLQRKQVREKRELFIFTVIMLQSKTRDMLRRKHKKMHHAALLFQKLYRGHRGRHIRRTENFRNVERESYDERYVAAQVIQKYGRRMATKAIYAKTHAEWRRVTDAALKIQGLYHSRWTRMKFMKEFHRMRQAACVIQAMYLGKQGRDNFLHVLVKKLHAIKLIQRLYRGYRSRMTYTSEVSKLRKAWKWFKPQHLQQSKFMHILPRNQYGVNVVTFPPKPSWHTWRDIQMDDMLLATQQPLPPKGLNPLESNSHSYDMGKFGKKKKKRRRRGKQKKKKPEGSVSVGASPIKEVTPSVLRALMRAAPVTSMQKPALGSNGRSVVGISIDRGLGLGPVSRKLLREKQKEEWRQMEAILEIEAEEKANREKEDRGSDYYSEIEDTAVYRHPWSDTDSEASNDTTVTIEPLIRANCTKREMKWRKFRSGLRQARINEKYIAHMLSVMQHGEKSLTFDDFHNTFKVSRPIPVVNNGKFGMTADAGEVYISILYELSSSQLDDPTMLVADDDEAVVQIVMDNFVFMDRHWKKLIKDLYFGTLHKALPLHPETRQEYIDQSIPMPSQAINVEKVLLRCGFHERAHAMEVGFNTQKKPQKKKKPKKVRTKKKNKWEDSSTDDEEGITSESEDEEKKKDLPLILKELEVGEEIYRDIDDSNTFPDATLNNETKESKDDDVNSLSISEIAAVNFEAGKRVRPQILLPTIVEKRISAFFPNDVPWIRPNESDDSDEEIEDASIDVLASGRKGDSSITSSQQSRSSTKSKPKKWITGSGGKRIRNPLFKDKSGGRRRRNRKPKSVFKQPIWKKKEWNNPAIRMKMRGVDIDEIKKLHRIIQKRGTASEMRNSQTESSGSIDSYSELAKSLSTLGSGHINSKETNNNQQNSSLSSLPKINSL